MHRALLVLIIPCLSLTGCGEMVKGKSVAQPQIEIFHHQLASKQFEEIYSGSSDEFRRAAPQEKMIELFSAIDRKLGPVKSSATTSWNVRTFNFKTTAVIVRSTKFEHGSGIETFTFRVSGDKAVLMGYHINSLDLITK
jgi:hypothetical protein